MPPHVFREFSGRPKREQWPVEFDLGGVERDSQIRKQKLEEIQTEAQMGKSLATNNFVGSKSIDLNRPERIPYNPNAPQNQYPKMLYHPTKKHAAWYAERKRLELYNSLHPEKPEILPVVPAAQVMVRNEAEEEARRAEGWALRPPVEADVDEYADVRGESMCSRGCGKPPHRGACRIA